MPRLIDADALRATFSNMTIFGYGDYVSGQKMMLDTIIDYIDAASTIDPEKHSQWISVKDRMPSDYEKVLTCDAHGNYHLFTHYHEFKEPFGISENHPRYYQPTHWMPLPEPPKGEDEDEN